MSLALLFNQNGSRLGLVAGHSPDNVYLEHCSAFRIGSLGAWNFLGTQHTCQPVADPMELLQRSFNAAKQLGRLGDADNCCVLCSPELILSLVTHCGISPELLTTADETADGRYLDWTNFHVAGIKPPVTLRIERGARHYPTFPVFTTRN